MVWTFELPFQGVYGTLEGIRVVKEFQKRVVNLSEKLDKKLGGDRKGF